MKLAPGTPLAVGLLTEETAAPRLVGRLAMASGLAQLEWSAKTIAEGLPLSPLHYPAEPGLHPARSRIFEGLHGFLSDCLPARRLGHAAIEAAAAKDGSPVRRP